MLLRHDNPTVREMARHADAVQVIGTVRANDGRDGSEATSVKGHTLELALEVGAAYVVTDDRELLALAKGRSRSTSSLREALRGITILTPAELVRDLTHDQSQERGQARSREHDQEHGR
jgi:predicted nucleic acid-binding protein